MIVKRIEDFTGGWFIGDFLPSIFKTNQFEVAVKLHTKDSEWDKHYHAQATEINCLVNGEMEISGRRLRSGDVFLIEAGEVSDPKFITDCQVVVVKIPCVKNDKFVVPR